MALPLKLPLKSKVVVGCEGGDGGSGGGAGGKGGAGGGGGGGAATPQLTATSANAASPVQELPRLYSKLNDGEYTSTTAASQESPWSPLKLHTTSPAALFTRSSPMVAPYMW